MSIFIFVLAFIPGQVISNTSSNQQWNNEQNTTVVFGRGILRRRNYTVRPVATHPRQNVVPSPVSKPSSIPKFQESIDKLKATTKPKELIIKTDNKRKFGRLLSEVNSVEPEWAKKFPSYKAGE